MIISIKTLRKEWKKDLEQVKDLVYKLLSTYEKKDYESKKSLMLG